MANPEIFEFNNAVVKIKDGTTPTALEITVALGEGVFSYTETEEFQVKRDRLSLRAVKRGQDQPVTFSLDSDLRAVTSTTGDTASLLEVLHNRGNASAWKSTGGACEPFAFDFEITLPHSTTCPDANVDDEVITLPTCRTTQRDVNFSEGLISIQGMSFTTRITSTRPSGA